MSLDNPSLPRWDYDASRPYSEARHFMFPKGVNQLVTDWISMRIATREITITEGSVGVKYLSGAERKIFLELLIKGKHIDGADLAFLGKEFPVLFPSQEQEGFLIVLMAQAGRIGVSPRNHLMPASIKRSDSYSPIPLGEVIALGR